MQTLFFIPCIQWAGCAEPGAGWDWTTILSRLRQVVPAVLGTSTDLLHAARDVTGALGATPAGTAMCERQHAIGDFGEALALALPVALASSTTSGASRGHLVADAGAAPHGAPLRPYLCPAHPCGLWTPPSRTVDPGTGRYHYQGGNWISAGGTWVNRRGH